MVKKQRQGHLQELGCWVGCGAERRAQLGLSISPSVIERLERTLRQALAPLACPSWRFCTERSPMRRRGVFFQALYNCARPHMSVRVPLPQHDHGSSGLLQSKGCHRTPAMAAGRTEHGWTFRELLTAKFAPAHSQSHSG